MTRSGVERSGVERAGKANESWRRADLGQSGASFGASPRHWGMSDIITAARLCHLSIMKGGRSVATVQPTCPVSVPSLTFDRPALMSVPSLTSDRPALMSVPSLTSDRPVLTSVLDANVSSELSAVFFRRSGFASWDDSRNPQFA
jgi:hypothetical protein